MRQIGKISRRDHAERFQDFLIAKGTKCSLDPDADGAAVWVHDDDLVPAAKVDLAAFLQNPDEDRFLAARAQADAVLKDAAAQRKAARRNTVQMSRRWSQGNGPQGPITVGVLVLCVFVFIVINVLGDEQGLKSKLFISTDGTWREILSGEWWRILTPAIMHGGLLHILFNLMAWWQLALPIEYRKGPLALLLMTTGIAAFSNTLQFVFAGPRFLGLSGVVFGIFGYLWIKGKLDPEDGLGVSRQTTQSVLIWFVICFMMPGLIANYAHAGGLIAGVTIGAVSAAIRTLMHRR
ncbi:MAG: hypothetical protein B7Z55_08590 [Planctomycetales bacterium 12-60-4]|nr:MAG: hypothetical protein B7Z55_08590 [Planctomycetales bacterium 12-60-4]